MTQLRCTTADWRVESDPSHFDTLSTIVAGPEPKAKKGTNRPQRMSHQMIIQVGGNASWQEQEANTRMAGAALQMFYALEELTLLVEDIREGRYVPDSFTTQPARLVLAAAHEGWTLEEAKEERDVPQETV